MGKVIYIKKCEMCKGKGKVRWHDMKDNRVIPSIVPCPSCKGRGMVREKQ